MKILAISIAVIMLVSSIAILSPHLKSEEHEKALMNSLESTGSREVTYRISNIFESYLKSTDYDDLGRHTEIPGLNSWFTQAGLRELYGEYWLRDSYPFVVAIEPYSSLVNPVNDVGYLLMAPYRLSIVAENVTECNTTYYSSEVPGDIHFSPLRGSLGGLTEEDPGGWVNMSLYMTYLTTQELNDIRNAGTHYANTYFGIATGTPNLPPPVVDDGYWHELQGHFDFNREAAMKYLGLSESGDLRNEWNTTTSDSAYGHDIEYDWLYKWILEGGGGTSGIYDIFTAYDYPNDIRIMRNILDWQNSTADTIRIRIYSISWGNDILIPRYLEACNVTPNWQTWNEDWYLNASIGPEMADFEMRATSWYHLNAWVDSETSMGAWSLGAQHIDWNANRYPNHLAYPSPYNDYDPETHPDIMRPSFSPGTRQFGNNVSFWITPMVMNLSEGEKMIVELPSYNVLGYAPYQGDSDDVSIQAKRDELAGNSYWGELVLGNCNPLMDAYYDGTTKTITINGPVDFHALRKSNYANPAVLEEGCPNFILDVSKVSDYGLTVLEKDTENPVSDPIPGILYDLRVTAKNMTGHLVTDWNGTVLLSAGNPSTILGNNVHTFTPSDNGIWKTTVIFGIENDIVTATDQWFPYDVFGSTGITPPPIPPVAVATASLTTALTYKEISFDGSASYSVGGVILEYIWDFGDGVIDYGMIASHIYSDDGVYIPVLIIRDELDQYATDGLLITINNRLPVAIIDGPSSGITYEELPFEGGGSYDMDGTIVSHEWDFGDGTTGNGMTLNHRYLVAGDYHVTLTVFDDDGASDSAVHTVSIAEGDVISTGNVTVIRQTPGGPKNNVVSMQFTPWLNGRWWAEVEDHGLNAVRIELFDISDQSPILQMSGRISFSGDKYSTKNTPEIWLTAMNTYLMTATPSGKNGAYANIFGWSTKEITNEKPIAVIDAPDVAWMELEVIIDGSGSYDPDGMVLEWLWDFGDGSFESGEIVVHTYHTVGIFNISLIVIDDYGLASDPAYSEILVGDFIIPVASISGPTSGTLGERLIFDGSGSYDPDGTVVEWLWDFGDGRSKYGEIVSHEYYILGPFTVTLVVTDDEGFQSDPATHVVNISDGINRSVAWTITEIGESYLKSTDYDQLGARTNISGVNSWWPQRTQWYGDCIVHNSWPYILASGSQNPIMPSPSPDIDWPYYLWTFYRMDIDARNLLNVNTRATYDPIWIPILDDPGNWYGGGLASDRINMDGGVVAFDWRGDYLTYQEMMDMHDGVHYANTYYGCNIREHPAIRSLYMMDDGWWFELHGTLTLDRAAAMKFLGLDYIDQSGADLRDIFLTANYYGDVEFAWIDDWMSEGGANGPYDIYPAYGYSQDVRVVNLELDPMQSTSEELVLRIYCISWGMDIQLWRYIEATDISPNWQVFPDRFDINGTIGLDVANIDISLTSCDNCLAWKDEGTGDAAWMIEMMHIDYISNDVIHPIPISKYNPYDPWLNDPPPTRKSWTPGIVNHGEEVFYAWTPMEMDLREGEHLFVHLPTIPMLGISPYAGGLIGYDPTQGLEDWKIEEILSYSFWGEISLGTCFPDLTGYYDEITKTVSLHGPIDFPFNPNPVYPDILYTGVPQFIFKVV